ncbi:MULTISPECIES: EF-P lysine aminoacylase EpmA [unclassified Thioalkalivibrio]|uniref:EF-P lysine aminoacylase EpmA n=1 Tax=unclassified Thioalkalivibrio TaxID=2621013 RepID=UPI000382F16F|nr:MULTISPECIES: EF-P lysine aminoacylase EpmA [unclassified Thioalkalivibrio]
MSDWRPGAAPARAARARLLAGLRAFFADRGVLEVETPILGRGAPQDPMLESWEARAPGGEQGYLQTSPEYPMKRLLADGAPDIYQIARVFRGGESGPRHNPEFTLLEWYRHRLDHRDLAREVVALIADQAAQSREWHAPRGCVVIPYAELFRSTLGLDPAAAEAKELERAAAARGLAVAGELDRDGWLDALISLVIAPGFPPDRLTVVVDYPESQAVLARPCPESPGYAARFELYWGDLELANGYHELTDPELFRRRRERDIAIRRARGQPLPPPDDYLEAALDAGLPDCAGVALGVDRLLMRLLGVSSLDQVLDFPWSRA